MPHLKRIELCPAGALPRSGARGFSLAGGGACGDVLVVCRDGDIRAYVNRCPHTGVNLDWNPGIFMDFTGQWIQCGTHGALFRPSDGYCIHGPCAGQSLAMVDLDVVDGTVVLLVPVPAGGSGEDGV